MLQIIKYNNTIIQQYNNTTKPFYFKIKLKYINKKIDLKIKLHK